MGFAGLAPPGVIAAQKHHPTGFATRGITRRSSRSPVAPLLFKLDLWLGVRRALALIPVPVMCLIFLSWSTHNDVANVGSVAASRISTTGDQGGRLRHFALSPTGIRIQR
jgi:hypothetical protein